MNSHDDQRWRGKRVSDMSDDEIRDMAGAWTGIPLIHEGTRRFLGAGEDSTVVVLAAGQRMPVAGVFYDDRTDQIVIDLAEPGHGPLSRPLADLAAEVARQDEFHPSGYPATRDGVFLGIKTAAHELDVEAVAAWRGDRCKCETPLCGHATWQATRAEMLQAAAVILRTIRSIDEHGEKEGAEQG